MLSYNPEADLNENHEAMSEAIEFVKTGQITYAVRDTQIDGKTIEEGNFMGILEGSIESVHTDKMKTIFELLKQMIDDDEDEIITILQGEDGTNDEVEQIEQFIDENFEDIEVEVVEGKQPIYSFIFSVE